MLCRQQDLAVPDKVNPIPYTYMRNIHRYYYTTYICIQIPNRNQSSKFSVSFTAQNFTIHDMLRQSQIKLETGSVSSHNYSRYHIVLQQSLYILYFVYLSMCKCTYIDI
jgi:hypothetical protein